jgi:peroxiredoxin
MNMRTIATFALFCSLGVAALAQTPPPTLPRKANEITIVEPSGKQTLLSSYKGKVVVLAFISTECPHCQKECEMLTSLYSEMKPKVQMAAVAFNDNARLLVPNFIRDHGVTFPVGSTTPEIVLGFMGFSVMDRPSVPQVAIIDKKGMIREQSDLRGIRIGTKDPAVAELQNPVYLRNLINTLNAEGAPTSTSKATPSTKPTPKGSTN